MDDSNQAARLRGRRILITGASSGVGLAAAVMFAREGAELVLVSRRADLAAEHLEQRGLHAIPVSADLADREEAEEAVRTAVEELGGLDVVVSNAAAAVFGHVLEVDPDDFDRTVAVTFTGAVNVIRAALPHLRESRGVVVATGSLMSRVPLPTWAAYTAAKHALRGFLTTLQVEEMEQGSGVRCAMVHPGPIDTPLFSHATSGTGRTPRVPPDAYRPEVVAQALVEAAIAPRAEVVLGGETKLMDLLNGFARPVSNRILVVIDRWYRSGDEPAPDPGSLWRPSERAHADGEIPARDSLMAPLQLGRRLVPDPRTPLRLARHLTAAGVRAAQLAPVLTRPRPERRHGTESEARPTRTDDAVVSV
jgi:NAD(P)-dependent dehydrogenase (short-subunit alcohol dehydrogenase family)